jgi:hypothetical protein
MTADDRLIVALDLPDAHSGLRLAQTLGVERPKAALLAPTEDAIPSVANTMESAAIATWARDHLPQADVAGPIAMDLILSRHAAEIKGYDSPVAGDADIIVTPNITTGNALFKLMALGMGCCAGGLVLGATGLSQRMAGTSWLREWVMFDAAARRQAEEVELPYWRAPSQSALEATNRRVEVVYEADGVQRRFAAVITTAQPAAPRPTEGPSPPPRSFEALDTLYTLEIRVDGQLVEVLSGVSAAELEPWIAAGGGLLGIVVRLEEPGGVERTTHLRFGTPGGTL